MSNVFTGLVPGNYPVTVKDANGATSSRAAIVYDKCPAILLSTTGETCQLTDGTITATATSGTAPYQFSIDGINFQNSNIFSGLVTGTYTITIKDALGFTADATINVIYACLTVNATSTNPTCGNNNGLINAIATNGTAPYQYSIDGINFQSSNVFSSLSPGNYSITAKDISGKQGNVTVTLVDNSGFQIITTTSPASCTNNDGSISIGGVSGVLPYKYSLDGINFQNNPVYNNLPASSYTAWIKDISGCLLSKPVTVVRNCPVVSGIVSNETCGSSNGSITASAINGTAPYQYSIDGINFQNSALFSGLIAGSYTLTVKDVRGIKNTTNLVVKNICPQVSISVTNGICGTAKAGIAATGSNGTAPYQYSIDGMNFQNSNIFTGLVTGTYTITIKDATGLTSTTNASVQNYPGPQIDASSLPASCLNNDAVINITGIGGTLPLQYSISGTGFQANNIFNNTASGSYTAFVKDVNGCIASQPVTVLYNNNLLLSTGTAISICEGKSVVLPASSNATSYTWSPSASLNNSQVLNPVASPMSATKYYITATLGICNKMDSVTVNVNAAPLPYAGNDITICYGQEVQLQGSGGASYEWTPSTYLSNTNISNPVLLNPYTSIQYHLSVRDQKGCTSLQDALLNVTVTAMPRLFAGADTSIIINQPFQLIAADVNNSGFTQYKWSPSFGLNNSAIQNPVATLNQNMSYVVTATTDQGCTGTDNISIKVYKGPDIYVPSAFTPNNDGLNDILKAIPVGIKEFRYFRIYNRWSELVFQTTDSRIGWDGVYKLLKPDTGVFIWMTQGVDDKGKVISKKGTVTLIR